MSKQWPVPSDQDDENTHYLLCLLLGAVAHIDAFVTSHPRTAIWTQKITVSVIGSVVGQ